MIRIGQGWDIHKLVEGRPLILGGVTIPHDKGLLGATLTPTRSCTPSPTPCWARPAWATSAAIFPDTDPAFHGVDSRILLRETAARLRERGWKVVNVDSTVIAQRPKLAGHIAAMRANIATDLRLKMDEVNVKAKPAKTRPDGPRRRHCRPGGVPDRTGLNPGEYGIMPANTGFP